MIAKRKIFIGSSTESETIAELVARLIEQEDGWEPLLWMSAFPVGEILMERIERLPDEVDGVVLLAAPDLECRRGLQEFRGPIPNVVFEHGYLSARLTRKRVAICRFEGVTLQTDLDGMTVIEAGPFQGNGRLAEPDRVMSKLLQWLRGLPSLAPGIAAVHRIHGYSGQWRVRTIFSKWRGRVLENGEKVYFNGTAYLVLPADGQRGWGAHVGNLFIDVGDYHARFKIANHINGATVSTDGVLTLKAEVAIRQLLEGPRQPPEWVLGDLPGDQQFTIELKPVSDTPRKLCGEHIFDPTLEIHQKAKEDYEYIGL